MLDLLLTAVISVSDRTITLKETGEVIQVGVGKNTLPGIYSIERKVINPIDYSHTTKRRIADGTYGDYALYMCRDDGYCLGIHGTNNQNSIGQSWSAGCIRLPRNREKEVFENILMYTQVEIR